MFLSVYLCSKLDSASEWPQGQCQKKRRKNENDPKSEGDPKNEDNSRQGFVFTAVVYVALHNFLYEN